MDMRQVGLQFLSICEYSVLMAASVNRPASGFARQLGAYLAHVVEQAGGDPSGRWLAARTSRGKGYVASLMSGEVAMNTNDIALFAAVFDVSPYQFVRDAREWDGGADASTASTPPIPPTDISSRRRSRPGVPDTALSHEAGIAAMKARHEGSATTSFDPNDA